MKRYGFAGLGARMVDSTRRRTPRGLALALCSCMSNQQAANAENSIPSFALRERSRTRDCRVAIGVATGALLLVACSGGNGCCR
jgi:hypothetical protein